MNDDDLAVLVVGVIFLPVFLLLIGCIGLYLKEGSSRIVSRTRKGRGKRASYKPFFNAFFL